MNNETKQASKPKAYLAGWRRRLKQGPTSRDYIRAQDWGFCAVGEALWLGREGDEYDPHTYVQAMASIDREMIVAGGDFSTHMNYYDPIKALEAIRRIELRIHAHGGLRKVRKLVRARAAKLMGD